MRVLVVGTLPPPGGSAARALAEAANELRAEGHEVELLSPDPRSAAHRHARLDGPLLALWLTLMSPRFDAVVLRFEPGLPLGPRAGRLMRAVTLSLLGSALRRFGETTIRFDGGPPVPRGLGGRAMASVFATTDKIVVTSEDKQAELIAISGLPTERVVIASSLPARTRADREGWTVGEDDDMRTGVLELIRARAHWARAADRIRHEIGIPGEPVGTSALTGDRPSPTPSALAKEAISAGRAVFERLVAERP